MHLKGAFAIFIVKPYNTTSKSRHVSQKLKTDFLDYTGS